MAIVVTTTELSDVISIQPSTSEDYRGSYVETYNIEDYRKNGITVEFVRDDISVSGRHVLRGIHYDDKTWKLIQCLFGRIYFVVIDMREDSAQYLKWQAFILSAENRIQILVPPKHGNGHFVLSGHCIFHYKMSEYYDPDNEKVLRWDDPKAGILWPMTNPMLSVKDSQAKFLP